MGKNPVGLPEAIKEMGREPPLQGVVQDSVVTEGGGSTHQREEIERVYRADAGRLWRALLGYTGSRELASDAVAEAFAQALAHGGFLRSPAAWVWTAAFRIAAGIMKQSSNPMHPITQDDADLPEPVTDLVRALSMLPLQQRLTIVMHDYADRPVKEVATALGISTATVYVHLSKGRRRLRESLEVIDE